MNDLMTGTGIAAAEDGTGKVKMTITVTDGIITEAVPETQGDCYCRVCAEAAAELLTDKTPADLLGMRNDFAVYWVDGMPGEKLWCSALSVTACKKAAADYLRKNGIPFDETKAGCGCL